MARCWDDRMQDLADAAAKRAVVIDIMPAVITNLTTQILAHCEDASAPSLVDQHLAHRACVHLGQAPQASGIGRRRWGGAEGALRQVDQRRGAGEGDNSRKPLLGVVVRGPSPHRRLTGPGHTGRSMLSTVAALRRLGSGTEDRPGTSGIMMCPSTNSNGSVMSSL